MKTKLFAVLTFALFFNHLQASALTAPSTNCECLPATASAVVESLATEGGDPLDLKIVVSQKRIYLVTDEMPMKCLKIKITNAAGKVVQEQCFSSKCAEWFLNIESLPKGEYSLHVGADRVEKFQK
jgi:hypothetical protein